MLSCSSLQLQQNIEGYENAVLVTAEASILLGSRLSSLSGRRAFVCEFFRLEECCPLAQARFDRSGVVRLRHDSLRLIRRLIPGSLHAWVTARLRSGLEI